MTLPDAGVRPAAVAGTFYPAEPRELQALVRRLLSEAGPGADGDDGGPDAIIAPHAGYAYSGPIAAAAYARVARRRGRVGRVVLVGPSHRVALRGIAGSDAGGFATPLGTVPLDRGVTGTLGALGVRPDDLAHRGEHALEVQLPFLLETLGPVPIVPLLTGAVGEEEVTAVLEALWDGDTLVVASSDLSHYLDRAAARRRDAATAGAIEALDPDGIGPGDACGRVGIQGLLRAARRRGLRVSTLDLRTSGDTAGGPTRVVGYGAFVFARAGGAARGGDHAGGQG